MEPASLIFAVALISQPSPTLLQQADRLMLLSERTVTRTAFTTQHQPKKWTKTKGATVGGLIGAGMGAGSGAWYCRAGNACDGEQVMGALFFAPFGAAIGVATGAVVAWVADR